MQTLEMKMNESQSVQRHHHQTYRGTHDVHAERPAMHGGAADERQRNDGRDEPGHQKEMSVEAAQRRRRPVPAGLWLAGAARAHAHTRTRDQRPQAQSKDRDEANTAWKRTNTDRPRVRLVFPTKS